MINFIALITSLRLKMLDRRINKLEREVRHFRLEVEELKLRKSYIFNNYDPEVSTLLRELSCMILHDRIELVRLRNKRRELQHG